VDIEQGPLPAPNPPPGDAEDDANAGAADQQRPKWNFFYFTRVMPA
jgi:hypothetical protein